MHVAYHVKAMLPEPPPEWNALRPDSRAIFASLEPFLTKPIARARPAIADIARADAFQDPARHEAALRAILHERGPSAPLEWHPLECLRLYRYGDPEEGPLPPRESHAARAFCCASLISEPTGPDGRHDDGADVVRLVASARRLNAEVARAAASLLAWAALQRDEDRTPASYASLGSVMLAIGDRPISDSFLGACVDHALELARTLRRPRRDRWSDHPSDSESAGMWMDELRDAIRLGERTRPAIATTLTSLQTHFLGA